MKTLKDIMTEAVTNKDIARIVNKYLNKIGGDPTARGDLLMQVASLLGRTSNVSPEELDVVLHKSYSKNYDPAKVSRGQTPAQRAGAQSKQAPPPLPPPISAAQQKQIDKNPEKNMPSLAQLAASEHEPEWKKKGLPSPDELEKSKNSTGKQTTPPPLPAKNDDEEDDIPMADPKDVKMRRKAASEPAKEPSKKSKKDKEIDMDTFGEKEPKEKPAQAAPASGKSSKSKSKDGKANKSKKSDKEDKPIPLPSFSSIARPMLKGNQNLNPKWKVGQVVDLGKAQGGYKVKGKTGSWYNLERNGQKYIFIPFKGLRKVKN